MSERLHLWGESSGYKVACRLSKRRAIIIVRNRAVIDGWPAYTRLNLTRNTFVNRMLMSKYRRRWGK